MVSGREGRKENKKGGIGTERRGKKDRKGRKEKHGGNKGRSRRPKTKGMSPMSGDRREKAVFSILLPCLQFLMPQPL